MPGFKKTIVRKRISLTFHSRTHCSQQTPLRRNASNGLVSENNISDNKKQESFSFTYGATFPFFDIGSIVLFDYFKKTFARLTSPDRQSTMPPRIDQGVRT